MLISVDCVCIFICYHVCLLAALGENGQRCRRGHRDTNKIARVWTVHLYYIHACTVLGLSCLHERRQEQCQKLFQQLAESSTDNCLHYLLPCMRDPTITNSLRHANKYPTIFAKTTKFKNSFICYGLSHYQLTA